jgi:hypothetical protein
MTGGDPDEESRCMQAFREDNNRFLLTQITQVYGGINNFEYVLADLKTVPLTICCGRTTGHLEQEFCEHGFTTIRQIADPTFSGFLAERCPR